MSNLAAWSGVMPFDTQPILEGKATMFSIAFKRPLVTLAVIGGLLVPAAPASAKTDSPKDQLSGVHLRVVGQGCDGGHRAVSDGTSNTLTVGEVAARTPAGTAFVVNGPFTVTPACDAAGKEAAYLLSSAVGTPSR